jgi:hypothetical protein
MAHMSAHGHEIAAGRVAATLPDSIVVAEDVAWDAARRRWLVSDLRRGRIVTVTPSGRASILFDLRPDTWAVFALGVDAPRGVLWATTIGMPGLAGYTRADSGRAALLKLELATGRLLHRFDFPHASPTEAHAPGDMAVAPNGDVFVSDGETGELFVLRKGADALVALVPAGELVSPQQPAVSPDGGTVLVADYIRGIAAVDGATGHVTWLAHGPSVALNGIDGLVFHGRDLIAMQNGTEPNRILRLALDPGMRAVVGVTVLAQGPAIAQPTHAAASGDAVVVIARSGWDRVARDGSVRTGVPAAGATLVRVPLR